MIIIDKLMENDFRRMRFIPRFSGQYLREVETDSDHVWEMISLALKLVPEWNKNITDNKLDIKDIIYRIVIHDLDECLTSDIPRTFKYDNPTLTKAIKDTVNSIMDSTFSKELSYDIKHSKDHDNINGFIVSIFDLVQVGLKYYNEINNCGNNSIKTELLGYTIDILNKRLEEIKSVTNNFPQLFNQLYDFVKNVITDLNRLY